MLDFMTVATRSPKHGIVEVFPKLLIKKSTDLMIQGSDFKAVFDAETGLWSTDEQHALYLIDKEVDEYASKLKTEDSVKVLHMWDADSGMIDKWHKYVKQQLRDNYHQLDEKILFSNEEPTKESYATKRLPYPLSEMDTPAYNQLISKLYSPEELRKIEWAIGSIIAGDSKDIQKFLVLYGSAGTGKSTVLNIIQDLFAGYYCVFEAKALGLSNSSFALEPFKANPLVAIQHDGDLSRIEDNTRLNSLVSHEQMTVNEKFKSSYTNRFNSFLFMGTNKPVHITDAKSGIIRRLIDVTPTGEKHSASEYKSLVKKVKFELGGIAYHCLKVYEEDPGYYDDYVPTKMLGASNDFYNFILDCYDEFKNEDSTTLKDAWDKYKKYCDYAKVPYMKQTDFGEELKNYFYNYDERSKDERRLRRYYSGFIFDKFVNRQISSKPLPPKKLEMTCTKSLIDDLYSNCKAQYATENETPMCSWADTYTTLHDISTKKLHYVKPPENHIVIDFDIKDASGNKCMELNAIEAAKWPLTYAEASKGGNGIHLHYIYNGDVSDLSSVYSPGIEVKTFTGGSSLRRKLSVCNDIPIAEISSGLPKRKKKMVNFEGIKNEKALRTCIIRNLKKENAAGTKPSIDFIFNNLEDAYNGGIHYDVTDMRPDILAFATNSTHHADYCVKKVAKMHFKSEEASENVEDYSDDNLVFFDIEVFPNLFIVVYKRMGGNPVKMINPTADEIEALFKFKLVGFNCRRYDNHILYARTLGYSNERLYEQSQRIINGSANAFFSEAYNISYTDVYDFSTVKQSLKKFEIELGIHHQECGLRWDQPVPEELWDSVADYCVNDVVATEETFKSRSGDWTARKILVDICKSLGCSATVNDTTNSLTTKIIFGNERHPALVYTDLATGEQY